MGDNKECNIVRDLLPLYVEGLASNDSREYVDTHLAVCPECAAELEHMREPAAEAATCEASSAGAAPLKGIKRRLRARRVRTALCVALLVAAALTALFAYLTSPEYLTSDEAISGVANMQVGEEPSGCVAVVFTDEVTGYSVEEASEESGVPCYEVEAWTCAWDRLFGERSGLSAVIGDVADGERIYYLQNNGRANEVIYGPEFISGGAIALPRLVLGYYALIAFVLLAVLVVARILLRKKPEVSLQLDRALALPASYLVAHLLVKGTKTVTYSFAHDFSLILLVTLFIWVAALLALGLRQARRAK